MRRVFTFTFVTFFLLATSAFGQTKEMNAGDFKLQLLAVNTFLNYDFCSAGKMPEFPGGTKKLVAFAKNKIHYPRLAVNDNIRGSVILRFVIDKRGRVVSKGIFKGVRSDLNAVCLNMLNQMPNSKPARLNDKALAVNFRWQIIFILTD